MAFLRRLWGAEEEIPQRPSPPPPPQPQHAAGPAAVQPTNRHTVPPLPMHFPHIGTKSVEELSLIPSGERPDLVEDYILEIPDVASMMEKLRKAHADNEELAASIVSVGKECNAFRDQILENRELTQKRLADVATIKAKRDFILSRRSGPEAAAELRSRAEVADNVAENELQSVLSGGPLNPEALSEFKKKYLENKCVKHRRLAIAAACK